MQETQFNQLRDYINKAYEQGLKDDQVIEQLTNQGWPKDDVMVALRSVKSAQIYANPTNINSVPSDSDQHLSNLNNAPKEKLNNNGNLPKYKVLTAFSDSFNAMTGNIAKVLLAGLISFGLYILFVVALVAAFIGIYASTGNGLYSTDTGVTFIAYFLVVIVFLIWLQAVFVTGISIPIKDAMDGQGTAAKSLIKDMFTKSWRVLLAEIGYYFIVAGPIIGLGIISSLFAGGVFSVLIVLLGSIVWVVLTVLRFYLAPYVALFDRTIPILQTYSKSYELLKGGGQWFLVKLIALIFIGYITFSIVSSVIASSGMSYGSFSGGIVINLVFLLIGFLASVVINGVSVALYVNRSNLVDPERNLRVESEPKQFSTNAAASPLSNNNHPDTNS